MNFSDRHSARLFLGLALLGALAGCRSAHYEPVGPQAMGYGVSGGVARRDPVVEAPRFRGPSEPVPLTDSEPSEGPVFPRLHDDDAPLRDPASGPTLRGFPVEEPEEEGPAYPGANRRTSASTRRQHRSGEPSQSPGTLAAESGSPLSASHKMQGAPEGRRTVTRPALRVAEVPRSVSERPALPVAATTTPVVEAVEEPDHETRNDPPPSRRPLPLTTRRSTADASGTGDLSSFDDAGSAGRSLPMRLADPPRLLAPPGQ